MEPQPKAEPVKKYRFNSIAVKPETFNRLEASKIEAEKMKDKKMTWTDFMELLIAKWRAV